MNEEVNKWTEEDIGKKVKCEYCDNEGTVEVDPFMYEVHQETCLVALCEDCFYQLCMDV